MSEHIHVNENILMDAALHHQEAADYLASVAASHEAVQATLNSLGPIYSEFRQAAASLLEARKHCYDQQSEEHSAVATNLRRAVQMWTEQEDHAATTFRGLTDEPQ